MFTLKISNVHHHIIMAALSRGDRYDIHMLNPANVHRTQCELINNLLHTTYVITTDEFIYTAYFHEFEIQKLTLESTLPHLNLRENVKLRYYNIEYMWHVGFHDMHGKPYRQRSHAPQPIDAACIHVDSPPYSYLRELLFLVCGLTNTVNPEHIKNARHLLYSYSMDRLSLPRIGTKGSVTLEDI